MKMLDELFKDIQAELDRARAKAGKFNSPHEGWAIIKEELDELWEHVMKNTGQTSKARDEALQVAAMAIRYIQDLCKEEEDEEDDGTRD